MREQSERKRSLRTVFQGAKQRARGELKAILDPRYLADSLARARGEAQALLDPRHLAGSLARVARGAAAVYVDIPPEEAQQLAQGAYDAAHLLVWHLMTLKRDSGRDLEALIKSLLPARRGARTKAARASKNSNTNDKNHIITRSM